MRAVNILPNPSTSHPNRPPHHRIYQTAKLQLAFGFLFVANALILAGTIAFPLTGLALDNVDKKELRNKDIFKTAYPPGA